ncbi:hypothetical protein PHYPSEUDO_000516 [Phytophthora pseudosyringae]|uniref:[F-actin]-monooxygenase MICAL1-3-like Rossman domain-containing protein n=1 Tax=Phytophthora pseudosyringae TaxID=221518 RepID=A0A8T1VY36_9STRA|nr:hypothetical protein PHYPSEUDO_000516 [Phytophthora pseudosyringae]
MADVDTHSSSSSDGGGDVFLSPRSSVASKRSVQSVPTVREAGDDQHQPETEPRGGGDVRARRETWVGEGLIDASGLEAIDRLSDVAYAEIVKESLAVQRDAPPSAADAAKLSDFLAKTYPAEGAGDAPKKAAQRRRKLLDFLANDVGERYLNGVYKDEERAAGEDETGLDELDSDDEPKFEHAEDLHKLGSRSARANSRLLAFLAHEQQDKRHKRDGYQPFSSAHSGPASTEPHNKFVTKVVPQKSRMMLFNPGEVDSSELSQVVALEAERKQKARADKELARQKVRQFLLEEEQEHAKRKGSGNEATIKSVDETTVRRETVVDDYGKVNLLDYLDRVVDDGHRSRNGGSVPSEMDESGPASEASSPRSIASSLEADTSTPFTQGGDDVSPPTPGTLSGMGSRFAQFLHRGGSSDGAKDVDTPRARRLLPPSPFHSKSNEKMSLEAAFHATKPPDPAAAPAVYSAASARMTPLLATLDQIAHTCQKNELSEVSIARISTLLASINQIIRDDIQKHRGQPNRVVRRLSGAHWVKSEHEPHEQEKPRRAPLPPPKPVAEVPREPNPVVSASATVDNATVKAGPGVLNAFKSFDAAQNLIETLSSFNKLLTECGLSGVKVDEPWRVYNHIRASVYSKLGFRHKQLFKLLDARFNMDVYKRKPAAKKRVCIIGAGPVGLRAAVEAALLGGQVVVLEKRKHFSRENILHLWPWVVQDLTALGAKVFFPSFCHSTAYFHVGTRQLQVILLKVALLVGVTVYSSTAFESVISPNSEESDNKPFYTVATQPQIPWMEFTAVLGASGTNDKLAEPAGINRFVFSRKEALGIVCYFQNLGTTEEKKVTEFSWTIQFKQQMFAKMREIGVDLENIVYYRGEMHYLVMTPKRQNLLDQQVLKANHPEPQDLVQDDNINKSTLHEYVKRVVTFLGIPKKAEFSRIRMFDFSSRTRADKAASILTSQGKKLYVGLIGDSLIEPFWPEGVGTCRGFLGALDGVWMVAQIGKKADEQLLADREMAYRVIQHVSGFRRDDLQKNVRKYTVDPKSRLCISFLLARQKTKVRSPAWNGLLPSYLEVDCKVIQPSLANKHTLLSVRAQQTWSLIPAACGRGCCVSSTECKYCVMTVCPYYGEHSATTPCQVVWRRGLLHFTVAPARESPVEDEIVTAGLRGTVRRPQFGFCSGLCKALIRNSKRCVGRWHFGTMETRDQASETAATPLTNKRSLRKLDRKPPVHGGSRDSVSAGDRLSDVDAHNRQRRQLLDYVSVDVGDNGYREDDGDDSTDGEDGSFYSDEPRSTRHQSVPYTSAPAGSGRAAIANPNEIDSEQLVQVVAEEAERKQKARAEKELAWRKVRQLLLEEEEKASSRYDSSIDSTSKSVDSSHCETEHEDNINTVQLLDSLARSGEDFSYNRSVSSDVDTAPVVDSSLVQPQLAAPVITSSTVPTTEMKEQSQPTFARHLDRMGNKITKFLSRGQASDDESNDLPKPRLFQQSSPYHGKAKQEPFVAGKSSVRLALLATLEQATQTVQRTELSEASMAKISAHLASIDLIAREDMNKKSGELNRGLRRLSSTQWAKSDNDSSDQEKDFRDPMPPAGESPSEYLSIPSAPPAAVETLQSRVGSTVLNSFKAFDAAQDLGDTLAAFSNLINDCGLNGVQVDEPWHVFYHIKAAVYSKLSFRHKQLFKLLDARFNVDVYKGKPASKKRVCIIGAGPVGLRAAVEAALLGSQVIVLEKREHFSRENMLRLWPWVVQDLASLGAKVFCSQFGKWNTYFHVSARQLQVILLKVALLVGVTVCPSTEFESVVPPGLEENGGKPFYTVVTQPQIPVMEFTSVLGASGTNDKLAQSAGINRFVYCNKEALGIVCYFPNLGTSDEMKMKEFSWTAQLKHPMLDKLRETGFDVENVVYYRGEMHYLVITPKRQSLVDLHVVNKDCPSATDLVKDDNINSSALHEFVKGIVDFAGIPKKTDFTRVSLLDFSSLTRADKAANILSSQGKKLYVGLIGDSLHEPLWHEAVGICRGFLSALDGVWMVAQIGKKADEQLLADREAAYQVTKRLSGHRRDEMHKNVRKYTVDPRSRYMVHFPRVV